MMLEIRPRRYLNIDELVVVHAFRGRGIGRKWMEEAKQWTLEPGIEEIELNVWERNPEATAFCEHRGTTAAQRRMKQDPRLPKYSQTSAVWIEIEGDSQCNEPSAC